MKKALALGTFGLLTLAATSAAAATRLVTGKLYYEDYDTTTYIGTKPIRDIVVTIKVNGTKITTATTSSDGSFSKAIETAYLPVNGKVTLELKAYKSGVADVYLDLDLQNHQLTFVSPQTTILSGTGDVATGKFTVTKANMGAHFNILDAIQYGLAYAKGRRDGGDTIGEVDVQYPDADWSNYVHEFNEITLTGPPSPWGYGKVNESEYGYFDPTILHEYGHHLEYDISDVDGPSLSSHEWCDEVGAEVAWKEGFPTYFAKAVSAAHPEVTVPVMLEAIPSCGSFNTPAGVFSALWDVHDGANEAHDRLDGASWTPQGSISDLIFKIFDKELDDSGITDPATNIHRFHDAFVARNPYQGAHEHLDRLLSYNMAPPPHQLCAFAVGNVTPSSGTAVTGAAFGVTTTLYNNSTFSYPETTIAVETYTLAPNKVTLDKTWIAPFTGTKTLTRGVIFPSTLQAGSYPIYVSIDPDDYIVEAGGENNKNSNVPVVAVVKCGDGQCSAQESCATCPGDCGSCCGNGSCESYWGENCSTCGADCGSCAVCGDGSCDVGEDMNNCPNDCYFGDW